MSKNSFKPSVSVAIPAYNEERVILNVLRDIFNQNSRNYTLSSVCVYSDGSTDNTVSVVKDNFSKVKVFDFKKNLGKPRRINQILENNSADILILIDADVRLKSDSIFEKLVAPIMKSEDVGLVCATYHANPVNSLVGKISMFGHNVWHNSRCSLGRKAIRYHAEGGLMLLSKSLVLDYRVPHTLTTGDDSYLFYETIELGYKVKVVKNAKVYIDLAEKLQDYIRQMTRFLADPNIVRENFNEDLLSKYETMSAHIKFKFFLREFIRQPIIGLCYVSLQGYCKIITPFNRSKAAWRPIERRAHA